MTWLTLYAVAAVIVPLGLCAGLMTKAVENSTRALADELERFRRERADGDQLALHADLLPVRRRVGALVGGRVHAAGSATASSHHATAKISEISGSAK